MVFDYITFPLEDAILKLNIASLEFLVVLVYAVVLLLLVPKKVVDSLHTRLSIHVSDHSHYKQAHWS